MIRQLVLVATLLPWGAGWAQQPGGPADSTKAAQQGPATVPPSHVEIYAGLRSNGGTNFMMGVKYTHRRPEWKQFGAAGFIEVVFADDVGFLFGALGQFYPTPKLLLETGPGLAVNGGSDFFWRMGAQYTLEAGRLVLIPQAYLDFIHGTTVVGYGIAIGSRR